MWTFQRRSKAEREVEWETLGRFEFAFVCLKDLANSDPGELAENLGTIEGEALVCLDLIARLPETKYRDVLMTRAEVAAIAIHTRVLKLASGGGVSEGEVQQQALDYVERPSRRRRWHAPSRERFE